MELVQSMASLLLLVLPFFRSSAAAVSGNFEITGLKVDSPFEVDPTSITNTTLSFVFNDQNTPTAEPASCYLTWEVGLEPPSRNTEGTCSDQTVGAWVPSGAYNGAANFQVEITHVYQNASFTTEPTNMNASFAYLNLTYSEGLVTEGYYCDMDQAICQSRPGAVMIANVFFTVP